MDLENSNGQLHLSIDCLLAWLKAIKTADLADCYLIQAYFNLIQKFLQVKWVDLATS